MSDDPRCCGTGTCIINAEGLCWCGQRWDGEKMCFMSEPTAQAKSANTSAERQSAADRGDEAQG